LIATPTFDKPSAFQRTFAVPHQKRFASTHFLTVDGLAPDSLEVRPARLLPVHTRDAGCATCPQPDLPGIAGSLTMTVSSF
jgi:hypothetical protein